MAPANDCQFQRQKPEKKTAYQMVNVLFRRSRRSSAVTVVNRSRSSIHRAASADSLSGWEAVATRADSSESWNSSLVIVRDLLFPDRKSERTQKNVTV